MYGPMLSAILLSSSAAGPLAITGPTTATEHRLVELTATNVPPDATLEWSVLPEDAADLRELPNGQMVFAAPPGDYRVKLTVFTLEGKRIVKTNARHNVTIVGKSKPMPKPPTTDPQAAVGHLRFGSSGCTATVIAPRRPDGAWDILTASHCTGNAGSTGEFWLPNGKRLAVRVTVRNPRPDITWLATEATDIAELPAARLCDVIPPIGTEVWHCGFGVDKPGNIERGKVIGGADSNGQIAMLLSVSSGDSGGAIFRADTGEVISCVCCTTQKGSRVTMYGGSSVEARKLRPGPAIHDDDSPEPGS